MISGFFSEEKVSEVRERSSLLEVISDYVTLKKTGRNYKGLCPFHSEKTPSFMVNEEKQIFHCFGCGEGGDIFTFLMKMGHFSFPQAVEVLAKRYGVKLPSRELSPSQKKELAKRDVLFQINQAASEYYHDLLTRQKEGEEARRYLSQRGIREEVVQEHRLGDSLDRWDGLVQYLQGKKLPLEMAWELGLILPKKKEGWYDAFRGRVLFPIFDLYQRVVGFGGRVMKEGEPKYLNSPESSIYHKGEILYGLHVAKRYVPAKDQVIIVEGYFDLLTLHQHGFKQGVATLGTALTAGHIRTLKRYTNNFTTVFDGDSAGVQANLRSLPLFLEEEVWGETVILPKGEDPDGFLRKGHQETFEKMVEKRIPLIDFFLEQRMKSSNMKSIEEKAKVTQEGLALIRKIPEGIRRNFYLKALAEKLDLQEPFLHGMLNSFRESGKERRDLRNRETGEAFSRSEEMVVTLMIHHPELIPTVSEEGILKDFESLRLKRMAEDLEDLFRTRGRLDLPEALEKVEEDLRERFCEFVFHEGGPTGDLGKILRDCFRKIRERGLRREKAELLKRIREAERERGGTELETLLMERQKMAERERTFKGIAHEKEKGRG